MFDPTPWGAFVGPVASRLDRPHGERESVSHTGQASALAVRVLGPTRVPAAESHTLASVRAIPGIGACGHERRPARRASPRHDTRPLPRTVFARVGRRRHDLKILRPVVELVAVDVVDMVLAVFQQPDLPRDQPMLVHVPLGVRERVARQMHHRVTVGSNDTPGPLR